jgi:signal transduction histidine kinase
VNRGVTMQLSLRTKIPLITALLVLAAVGVNSTLYLITLTREVISQANNRAQLVSQQVFLQAYNALREAASAGGAPASSSPDDLREYVRKSLDENAGFTSLVNTEVSDSPPLIYEVTITDIFGVALISSDSSLRGKRPPLRADLSELVSSGFLRQLRVINGPPQVYEVSFPFKLGPPGNQVLYGYIRVALQTALLRNEINPALKSAGLLALASVVVSVLLAGFVSNISLAPLKGIMAQLDRISQGEPDQAALARTDEFGQVSTKISRIGMQLRGVREIFSTLRENLDQVLGGLDDGILLFSLDGRAVMVSPAVERFLAMSSDKILGNRAVDIFPADHPIRGVIKLRDGEFEPVSAAEVTLGGPHSPVKRVGISVQVISEGGTHLGALVTFTDLESRERINTELQVSERMAQLGRITAGVAHEVKNPLNSMRLWLENLKDSLPEGNEVPLQAVRVLDKEIDRLDSVVKRFLDFTRPPDLHLEEANLEEIIDQVLGVARPQIEKNNIQLDARFGTDAPQVLVDRQLLIQALVNLVLNAIEAMPEGGTLTIFLERRGEMAEIRIQDTGRGIAPEYQKRIFQLFFTTRPGGSGIGLASTFRTVQLLNGSIDFTSEVGHGTIFRIELPLARQGETAPSRPRDAGAAVARNV